MKTASQYASERSPLLGSESGRFGRNEKLVRARKQFGLSQFDVCEALRWRMQRLSNFETGHRLPGLVSALTLAKFYESTVDELFGHLLKGNDNEPDEEVR